MPSHTPEEQARNQGQVQQQPQDLGQSLEQPQPVGASPSFRNAVDGFFQDPVNRAGLLSFGLNMLSGGFGTPLQQFAHAAGQGIESAAGAEEFQTSERRKNEQQDFQERQLGQRATLSREKDAAALERTLIAARTRIQSAGLSGTSLANKALSQAGSEYTAVSRTLRQNQFINNLSEEEIQAQAQAAAQNKLDTILGITESAFPGSTQSAIPGGGTRQNIPSGAAPGQPPPGPSGAETARPNSIDFTKVINDPSVPIAVRQAVDRAARTDEGRRNLIAKGFNEATLPAIGRANLGGPAGAPPVPKPSPRTEDLSLRRRAPVTTAIGDFFGGGQ